MENLKGLSFYNRLLKRSFDLTFAIFGLFLCFWLIILGFIISTIETKKLGFFTQYRIGRYGRPFKVIKIRTMKEIPTYKTTITTLSDPRITLSGRFFRKTKIDELPQLINVLLGQMSFVGPRPDVPGFADFLKEGDRVILMVRPGITGPATIKYKNEEQILANQENPEKYNQDIIYPDKVSINKKYIENYRFMDDMNYIYKSIL